MNSHHSPPSPTKSGFGQLGLLSIKSLLVTPTDTTTSSLSILPPQAVHHHMAPLLSNPGLVSPTESQPVSAIRKNSTSSSSAGTEDPILLAKQACATFNEKHALIIPRPPGHEFSKEAEQAARNSIPSAAPLRLNKFVRRLHDMLVLEKDSGIVEWRRGLLVLFSTDMFSKKILPKYFNTRNFKTFRRQLNYYGFVHVRSFSATGSSTTALWINQELARNEANDDVSAVLKLRRVEPNEAAKTVEGRRQRKELALHTVEEDIGLDAKRLQLDQIRSMAIRGEEAGLNRGLVGLAPAVQNANDIPRVVSVPSNSMDSDASDSHSDPDVAHHHYEGSYNNKPSLTSLPNPVENNTVAANMLLMLAKSS